MPYFPQRVRPKIVRDSDPILTIPKYSYKDPQTAMDRYGVDINEELS